MPHIYVNPALAHDPTYLPGIEVFELTGTSADDMYDAEGEPYAPGWYWWACFPGCLPDGDGEPYGPFDSFEDACEAAREGMSDEEATW